MKENRSRAACSPGEQRGRGSISSRLLILLLLLLLSLFPFRVTIFLFSSSFSLFSSPRLHSSSPLCTRACTRAYWRPPPHLFHFLACRYLQRLLEREKKEWVGKRKGKIREVIGYFRLTAIKRALITIL